MLCYIFHILTVADLSLPHFKGWLRAKVVLPNSSQASKSPFEDTTSEMPPTGMLTQWVFRWSPGTYTLYYKASHAILMYSSQVWRNRWPRALARGKGSTKDNALNIEHIPHSIKACRMVDLLIYAGASLRQNNEGSHVFHWNNYSLSFIPSRALCHLSPVPYQNLLSGPKKKISCHLYTLKNKISASQILYDQEEDQYFRKTQ